MEKWAAEAGNILTENQIRALERAKEEKEAYGEIDSYHPGFLLGQDTFYVGWIKGNVPLIRTLTDRSTEYCGDRENHPYQLFLYINDIEHTKTKARHPQTNGIIERFNQTLLDDFYSVFFRKKVYTSLEEIQSDLDEFLFAYNNQRTNQGKHCKGKTPMETFIEGLDLCKQYVHDKRKVMKKAA